MKTKAPMITPELLAAVPFFSEDAIVITTINLEAPGPEIIYVNPAFTRMTGYTSDEVIGKSPRLLQGPKTDREVLKRLKKDLLEGRVFFGCAVNYRKDGQEYWNEWHIEPIKDAKGRLSCYLAMQREVTARKKMEQELAEQKAALEQKNAALREILEHIQLEKQQIKKDVHANVDDVVIPIVKKLQRKGSKLEKGFLTLLEKNLKDLSSSFGAQVTHGKLRLSPREIEIANMIKNGMSNKEIGDLLNLSIKTIETHRNRIRKKLGLINKNFNLTSFLQQL